MQPSGQYVNIYIYTLTNLHIQDIRERMVQFQELLKMCFSPYTSTTYTVNNGNCLSFSCINVSPSVCAPWVTRYTSKR
jgi:hypothetical protein